MIITDPSSLSYAQLALSGVLSDCLRAWASYPFIHPSIHPSTLIHLSLHSSIARSRIRPARTPPRRPDQAKPKTPVPNPRSRVPEVFADHWAVTGPDIWGGRPHPSGPTISGIEPRLFRPPLPFPSHPQTYQSNPPAGERATSSFSSSSSSRALPMSV